MRNIIKFINQKHSTIILLVYINSLILLSGCKKLIEVNTPTTSISTKNVYTNDQTAIAVLTGLYTIISGSPATGSDLTSIGLITGLSGDELTLYSGAGDPRLKAYYQNNLKNNTSFTDFWAAIYNEVYVTNAAIEGLNSSSSLTPSVKQQLLGEAKFYRAFCYYHLLNMYGDVPLVIGTEYTVNIILSRSPKEKVWALIISDLQDAETLLTPNYLDGSLLAETTERIRPTKWAAAALLARSYLYTGDWKNAELRSTEVINNTALYNLDSLNKVFLMNSREAIWQLQPVNYHSNTEDAKIYVLPSTGPSIFTPVYLSPQLINSFEPNDQRKRRWVDTVTSAGILYYYPYKYKLNSIDDPLGEYNTVLRLGEQYLLRAEARAQQGNIKGAKDDLNLLRNRAGLQDYTNTDQVQLLAAIYHERQVELFTEWGHRWFDLKRIQTVNKVMEKVTPLKGGSWSPNWQLFPLPSYDIRTDGNLTQNAGY